MATSKLSRRSTTRPLRSSTRRRGLFALSALALGVTASLAVGTNRIGETEASWTDTEVAKASMTAEWANGGWARTATNAYTNHASFPKRSNSLYEWTNLNNYNSPASGATGTTGSYGDLGGKFDPFTVRTADSRPATSTNYCVQAAAAMTAAPNQSCGGSAYTLTGAQTRAQSYGAISGGLVNPSSDSGERIRWVEANNFTTRAECGPDGTSFAAPPTLSNSSWGNGIGLINSFSTTINGSMNQSTTNPWYKSVQAQTNKRVTTWVMPNYANGWGSYDTGDTYVRVTLTSRAYAVAGYALSDVFASIDVYSSNSGNPYLGTFTMVFGRSECAVTTPSRPRVPLAQEFENPNPPAYVPNTSIVVTDAPVPGPDGHLQAAAPAMAPMMLARAVASPSTATTPTSPAATTPSTAAETSPASTVSTSAPPFTATPDSSTATVTSTATAPTSASPTSSTAQVPASPGTLSAIEQVSPCGSVQAPTADGASASSPVLVKGSTCPSDADQARFALDRWINSNQLSTSGWTVFTSQSPDSEGWRWAAISQTSGTTAYIR